MHYIAVQNLYLICAENVGNLDLTLHLCRLNLFVKVLETHNFALAYVGCENNCLWEKLNENGSIDDFVKVQSIFTPCRALGTGIPVMLFLFFFSLLFILETSILKYARILAKRMFAKRPAVQTVTIQSI